MFKGIDMLGDIVSGLFDRFTRAVVVLSGDHSYIHEGYGYGSTYKATALASSGTVKLTFLTPASTSGYIHMRPISVSTSGDKVTVDLYEGSSGNTGGSAMSAVNRNRNSAKTSVCTLKSGVTVTTNGTLVDTMFVGGGTGVGGAKSGSETGDVTEMVLKAATLYTILITNGSSSANDILTKLFWYEELMG